MFQQKGKPTDMLMIVDIGVGNLGSIVNMFKKVGVKAVASDNPGDFLSAKKIVLPGVGAFDEGMRRLEEGGFIGPLNQKVLDEKTPVIGICLGSQLLGKSSEEGVRPGLGWIDMEVVRFPREEGLRVPHMGWNVVKPKSSTGLFAGVGGELRYYFVHTYHMKCANSQDIAGVTHYGSDFTSAVHHENIYGVQFHPEKSHRFGAALLKNFAEL